MNIELDANLELIDLVNNLEIIDLSAIANNLELTSNIMEDALTVISPVNELISENAIGDLASNISETELIASELKQDSIANLTDKDITALKSTVADITAQIIGAYAKFLENASYSDEITKIVQYNKEYFDNVTNIDVLSMTLTRTDFDFEYSYDTIDIKPIKHTNDIIMTNELVTEQLIFNFTKYLYETFRAVEFVDYFAGNQRGGHDGYRGFDAISMRPSHIKNDIGNSTDNTLLTVYKNIHDSVRVIDRLLGDSSTPYGVSDQKHPVDSLQVILHNYFLEEYVSLDYVGATYLIQG
jgi:hypothetical protein